MKDRKYGTPILLNDEKGKAHRLTPIPFGEPPFQEEQLQKLLADHPEIIPISEIEPAFSPLVFLGREVPTSAGPADLLFASPSGYLTLVETKLWSNPAARRQVVAQIIDYATALSQWSFDDLREALQDSLTSGGAQENKDVLTIMEQFEGDFDPTNFIDAVSRNLSRGYFLLLVIGNGIREGVESISNYLQQTPGLHFSLALVELNLYRVNTQKEYPIFIQPRTVAKTVELVRAVVDINAPNGMDVDVKVPTEEEVKKGKTRRKLTETIFYEELAENTTPEMANEARLMIQDLKELGLITEWRSSSVSIRLPDPGESGLNFTLVVLTLSGTFYFGWLDRVTSRGGYDESIVLRYTKSIAELVDPASKESPDDEYSMQILFKNKSHFLNCVKRFISDIKEAARQADSQE